MKTIATLFATALLLTLPITFVSCSDDDDHAEPQEVQKDTDNATPEELELIKKEGAVLSVMVHLTGEAPDLEHLEGMRYDSVIYGQQFNYPSLVRQLVCETPAEAEQAFRELVGLHGDSLLVATGDGGLKLDLTNLPILEGGKKVDVGTLTFYPGDTVRVTGRVEVDIPSIPHLQEIEYIRSSAIPHNANSAYLAGDLVRYTGSYYCTGYYLCVQSAEYGEGILVHLCKGEAKGDETTNLDGDNEGTWYPHNNACGQKTTINDVKAYVEFLGQSRGKVQQIKDFLNGKGLIKKPSASGKLWHVMPGGFDNNGNYAYRYVKNGYTWYGYVIMHAYFGSLYWGWHKRWTEYAEIHSNAKSRDDVSGKDWWYIYDSTWDSWYDYDGEFFTMNVVHFSSTPLSGFQLEFSPQNDGRLVTANNADYITKDYLGWCYASDNYLYQTASEAKAYGAEPLGVVVYVNDGSDWGNKVTEKDAGYGHALVMAMRDAGQKRWNSQNAVLINSEDVGEDNEYTQWVNTSTGGYATKYDFNGIEKTRYLAAVGSPAALVIEDYSPKAPMTSSGWFLPTTAQWLATLCSPGVGGKPMPADGSSWGIDTSSGQAVVGLDDKLKAIGGSKQTLGAYKYWTSSAFNAKTGIYINLATSRFTWYNWSQYAYVRPVFAF